MMEIVDRVTPIKIPPPIKMLIELALAETTAPMKAISGGMEERYRRSRTSDRRPTIGERTLCMSRGPYVVGMAKSITLRARYHTCMTQPERPGSPKSRSMNAMTDPAAVTTNTWAMIL